MKLNRAEIARSVATELKQLPDENRAIVLAWARDARTIIEDQDLTKSQKLTRLGKVRTSQVAVALLQGITKRMKIQLWDERGWPSRMAIIGLGAGVAIAGSKAAGVAAAGTSIAVKTYLLTAGGGALLGVIIEELEGGKKTGDKNGNP